VKWIGWKISAIGAFQCSRVGNVIDMPPHRRTRPTTSSPPPGGGFEVPEQSPAVPLDEVDRRILVLLSEDSRRSQRALARELGMSAPAVRERIGRLERLGVIRGYGVKLDWSAAGYPMTVYLSISAVQGYQQGEIVDQISRMPEVEWLDIVTGGIDMLARLRVRDHAHLRQVLVEQIWKLEGVQRTETSLAIVEIEPRNLIAELLSAPPEDQE
jgi:Lrp/AsnC family leucine-responsive transcriptional regulator